MMTKRFILLFTALAFILAGCDKDDGGRRNKAVEQTLYQLYPDASHLDWDYDGNYVVVDFRSAIASDSRAAECEAWFDYNGSWYLTEFDIRFNELPAAVINAFNSSAYGSWYVEDVERIDRVGYASVYIIQVEDRTYGNDMEYDLYYDAQGILIKEIADGPDFGGNYGDFLPPTGSDYTAIREFIKNKYPNGQIVDIERESNGYTDVDIIDNRISKDVVFDASGDWVYTTYEVAWTSLPAAVTSAFNSSAYKEYYVDDIDFYETADKGNYYRFDLESLLGDIKIYITENGTVSTTPGSGSGSGTGTDNPGSDVGVNQTIQAHVEAHYPGAVILDKDEKNGLTEVEILYNNAVLELFFNGSNQWVKSEQDVKYSDLPAAVKSVIDSTYSAYRIDDIELVETPTEKYYKFDMLQGNEFIMVNIAEDGTVI